MAIRKWGGETQVNTQTVGAQQLPRVASLLDGGFVVIWTDESAVGDGSVSAIKMQRYGANGMKAGIETLVNTTTFDRQSDPDISVLGDGSFIVTWFDESLAAGTGFDIRYRRFNPDGTAINATDIALPYANGQGDADVVALNNGGFAFAFSEYLGAHDNIFIDIFAANGTLQYHVPIATTALIESIPAVTPLTNGYIVATYVDVTNDLIRLQLVDATTGTLEGAPINVPLNADSPRPPQITALAGGGFVVTWRDTNQPLPDDQGAAVRARVYTAGSAGVPPVGGVEFTVNTLTTGSQSAPSVTALPDGGFAIVYESQGLGGAIYRTMIQLFNADGTKRGGEYVVDTYTSASDSSPDVSVLADGRIAVTWASNNEIVVQVVDPRDGLVNGSENAETLFGNDIYNDEMNGWGGADIMYGLAGADTIHGGDGNNTLHGGRGDDTLFGGVDQDSMLGGLGADEMDGGDGVDTANYALAAFAVTASLDGTLLGSNEALDDTYISIENLTGTNIAAQGDNLRGDAAANSIAGLAGNDSLNGVAGHDRLTGGNGIDTMTGGIGNDSFIYNTLTEGGDIITDFSSFAANNNDVFRFKGSVFGSLAAGAITAAQFQSSTSNVAATGTVDFFYETDTRILRFDADGSGAGASVIIATLQVGATMTFNDILIF